jgi:hypothetical protein
MIRSAICLARGSVGEGAVARLMCWIAVLE